MVKKKSIKESNRPAFSAVVIGASAGGLNALAVFCQQIPASFRLPVIIVLHLPADSDDFLARKLDSICRLPVNEACEKEKVSPAKIYTAPANYHLLIEKNETFALNIDTKVNYCRPSIDVLFESAANAYEEHLIGVILTGANNDGARGLKYIKEMGGVTLAQQPESAEVDAMPRAAIELFDVDFILPLQKIYPEIKRLTENN